MADGRADRHLRASSVARVRVHATLPASFADGAGAPVSSQLAAAAALAAPVSAAGRRVHATLPASFADGAGAPVSSPRAAAAALAAPVSVAGRRVHAALVHAALAALGSVRYAGSERGFVAVVAHKRLQACAPHRGRWVSSPNLLVGALAGAAHGQ